MMAVQAKNHSLLVLGSMFTISLLYLYYQTAQQQNCNMEKNEQPRKENLAYKNFLGTKNSFTQTRASGYNQDDILEDDSPKLSLANFPDLSPAVRPSNVTVTSHKEGCLPYFKTLHVQPVPEHDCDQPYVLMNDGGRLGNKLCQYASLYLLRHLYGVRVAVKGAMKSYLDGILKNVFLPSQISECFTKKMMSLTYEAIYKKLYIAARQAKDDTGKNLITAPLLNESYYVCNYPAPRELLLAHRNLVHSLIRFKDEVLSQAIQHINKAIGPFNATYRHRDFHIVTVHVRRTDYADFIMKNYNLPQLDDLYYNRAFEFYKTRLNRPVFLVLSDDASWCKKNLQAQDVIVVASKSATIDMAVMSLGDHHITSYGTFSLIGALLGRGHITHPISQNGTYNIVDCVPSAVFHYISRDETYVVDNSHVRLV